ncbi:hypothetical protein [Marinobacterium rhizophilum]|uniref:DUF3604 domain-containing protein n=1 Tax=Marinobacterium rhizophilum TaxID=420402 RepID=A0ABY5HH13_9GAMM|nr:hypothetical protein [Marinobacterium rhizophilum]UTW10251.1 hypothetical protein KDW95_13155 [Marinobacterium rhizophilum]
MTTMQNPYRKSRYWLKGNIHVHSDRSTRASLAGFDSEHGRSIEEIYARSCQPPFNFDFICASISVFDDGIQLFADTPENEKVTAIPGREIQNETVNHGTYTGGYFESPEAKYLHVLTIGNPGGLSICCHPMFFEKGRPRNGGAWKNIKSALLNPCEKLAELKVAGIEIYNGLTMMENHFVDGTYGADYAQGCWGDMLMAGYRYLGFAGNDEFYREPYIYEYFSPLGYIQVACDDRSVASILAAITRGQFYASTGIQLAETPLEVETQPDGVEFSLAACDEVIWSAIVHEKSGPDGWALNRYTIAQSDSCHYRQTREWKYIRFQAQHPYNPLIRAWLQPLYGPCWEDHDAAPREGANEDAVHPGRPPRAI